MNTVAIDQGTTSTRAVVVGDDGGVRVAAAIEHRQHYPRRGWVEHDAETLLDNIRRCLDRVDGEIAAVGLANQGESCLGWHADSKRPVTPLIVWQDDRTQNVIDGLKARGAEALTLARAGLPLDSYFSASKLGWIVREVPEAQQLLRQHKLRLGTSDAFFLDRLLGRCVTDLSTASRTSLLDLENGRWDAELCELFGVPIETLPQIVPTVCDYGELQLNGRAVPLSASVVDQQASLYGHGCRRPGDAKITFGTGAFALTLTGARICRAPQRGLLPTVAWQRAGAAPSYALDGGVYCASSALNWARSLGLFERFEQIERFDAAAAIERDLVFVPALTGLACPHWDRRAAGMWLGLSLDTTSSDMVQAVLEGVALRAAEVMTAMGDYAASAEALSIDGGLSANPYFCQFLADALGRDVAVPQTAELTALGTALLAAAADRPAPLLENRVYSARGDGRGYRQRFGEAVARAAGWKADRE